MTVVERDEQFMAEALRLGRQHDGETGDNPSVGAVLVCEEKGVFRVIGRGVTGKGGRPHAETQALRQAKGQTTGATLYVTLEPCCHFGKTPPCTRNIIEAGVARVVIALRDPDMRVSGRGIAELRQAGLEVELGCLAEQAAQSLAVYLCHRKFFRPFITAKLALSADGCIGRLNAGQVALTGSQTQRAVHMLRAAHDGVLVGIGTALADNPRLDCRLLVDKAENRMDLPVLSAAVLPRGRAVFSSPLPIRLVMDTKLRLAENSYLVQSVDKQPVWVLCGQSAAKERQHLLEAVGCRVLPCAEETDGQLNILQVLAVLFENRVTALFLEGGAKLIQSFWDKNLVDQLILFQTTQIIGKNGYKMPEFGKKSGYRKLAEQNIGTDKAEIWLRLNGKTGLLGDNG